MLIAIYYDWYGMIFVSWIMVEIMEFLPFVLCRVEKVEPKKTCAMPWIGLGKSFNCYKLIYCVDFRLMHRLI